MRAQRRLDAGALRRRHDGMRIRWGWARKSLFAQATAGHGGAAAGLAGGGWSNAIRIATEGAEVNRERRAPPSHLAATSTGGGSATRTLRDGNGIDDLSPTERRDPIRRYRNRTRRLGAPAAQSRALCSTRRTKTKSSRAVAIAARRSPDEALVHLIPSPVDNHARHLPVHRTSEPLLGHAPPAHTGTSPLPPASPYAHTGRVSHRDIRGARTPKKYRRIMYHWVYAKILRPRHPPRPRRPTLLTRRRTSARTRVCASASNSAHQIGI